MAVGLEERLSERCLKILGGAGGRLAEYSRVMVLLMVGSRCFPDGRRSDSFSISQ